MTPGVVLVVTLVALTVGVVAFLFGVQVGRETEQRRGAWRARSHRR